MDTTSIDTTGKLFLLMVPAAILEVLETLTEHWFGISPMFWHQALFIITAASLAVFINRSITKVIMGQMRNDMTRWLFLAIPPFILEVIEIITESWLSIQPELWHKTLFLVVPAAIAIPVINMLSKISNAESVRSAR